MNNRQLFFQHLAQTSDKPIGIEVASSEGIYIKDVNGKKWVDMIAGFSVCNIGHSHPEVIKAIQEQVEKYMHVIVYACKRGNFPILKSYLSQPFRAQ